MDALYIFGLIICCFGGVFIGLGEKLGGFLLWLCGFGIVLIAVAEGASLFK